MIANGAILTYVGTWQLSVSQGIDNIKQAVFTDLQQAGIAVIKSDNPGIFSKLFAGSIQVNLTLQVENGVGFNSADDVRSIVDGFVYQETGSMPAPSNIPYQQNPGDNSPTPTHPGLGTENPNQPSGCIAGTNNDLTGSFSLGCWFSNLTTSGLSTVGMLVIIAIVGLILLSKTERVLT